LQEQAGESDLPSDSSDAPPKWEFTSNSKDAAARNPAPQTRQSINYLQRDFAYAKPIC